MFSLNSCRYFLPGKILLKSKFKTGLFCNILNNIGRYPLIFAFIINKFKGDERRINSDTTTVQMSNATTVKTFRM